MSQTSEPIPRYNEIQDLVKTHYPDADLALIQMAYIYSARVHRGQTRISGEPYLVHPVAVAKILAEMKMDEAAVATGLLHDTVEDTLATLDELEQYFGKDVAEMVDGVTKISKIEFQSKEQRQAENFRKMILAMSRDIRVLIVKLADRLHNMRTLSPMPPESQKRIARETMEIYAPLAARLGIYWIWTELEDLAFRYTEPERYNEIRIKLEDSLKQREPFVNNVIQTIKDRMKLYSIVALIKGRNKEVYSIYRKMQMQNLQFEQIHDLTAFRIILTDESECYAVLGLIHSMWRPVPGRFKDYIAMPKSNGYQSLHTTVIGPEGARIEIQIRTQEMDRIAEEGIAAHWSYKEGKVVQAEDVQLTNWLRQIMEYQQEADDPREFLENVRVDLYPDEVYVFTPKGEVKVFPKGSTPLDFAYSIHTEVGHRCVGARVNGKMVPLKHSLNTGDCVEIVTSVHQKPSKDWLRHVKTGRARTKIRHYVLAEERDRSIQMGRDSVERELRKWRMDLSRIEREGEVLKIAQEHSFKTETDLYAAVGYGRVSPKVIITKVVPAQEREKAKLEQKDEEKLKPRRSSTRSGVRIEGLADVMVNFARCCNPLPGDPIRGFITRGRGVTIHKGDCPNLDTVESIRIVDATWDEEQSLSRIISLEVYSENRIGMLANISGVFSSNDSDIVQASVKTLNDHQAQSTFMVYVKNLEHLTRIMNSLRKVKGVERVARVGASQISEA